MSRNIHVPYWKCMWYDAWLSFSSSMTCFSFFNLFKIKIDETKVTNDNHTMARWSVLDKIRSNLFRSRSFGLTGTITAPLSFFVPKAVNVLEGAAAAVDNGFLQLGPVGFQDGLAGARDLGDDLVFVRQFRPVLVVVPFQKPAVSLLDDLPDQPPVEAPLRRDAGVLARPGENQLLEQNIARVACHSFAGFEENIIASRAFDDVRRCSRGSIEFGIHFDHLSEAHPLFETSKLDVSGSCYRYKVDGDAVSL